MKPVYAVLNISKSVITEDGLLFGPGQLTEGGTYNAQYFTDRAKAEAKADEFARGGTAAAVFELVSGHVLKPTPVKVLSFTVEKS